MDEPSKAAKRILLGTGFGLFLVCGFALIEGRMDIAEVGIGHLFLVLGMLCIMMAKLLDYQTTFLATYFPGESEKDLRVRVDQEINQLSQENRVGDAWAKLESRVLSDEINLEQE